jgi:hypothetical protein
LRLVKAICAVDGIQWLLAVQNIDAHLPTCAE